MNKLYLHIGTSKTGSSALQSFFTKNKDQLYKDGIWYPDLAAGLKVEEKLKVFAGNGINLREYAVNLNDLSEQKKLLFEGMFEKFRNSDKDILLSDELLYSYDEIMYKNLMDQGFDVRVIVFLRRQDLWGESHWNQIVKMGSWADNCFDTIQKLDLDYYNKVKKIADIVGKENLIILAYESGEADIFTNFLNALGIFDIDKYQKDKYQANPSLSANFIEIKRILNGIPGSELLMEDARDLLEEGRRYSLTGDKIGHAPSFLNKDERVAIIEKYHQSNTLLAKEFLGKDVLFNEAIENIDQYGIDVKTIYQDIIKFFGMLSVFQYKELEKIKDYVYKFKIPESCKGKSIVVYGIDRLGNKLYHQLESEVGCSELIAVDRKWVNAQERYKIPVINPESVNYENIDYVMIAVRDDKTYGAIRQYLVNKKNLLSQKILRMLLEA